MCGTATNFFTIPLRLGLPLGDAGSNLRGVRLGWFGVLRQFHGNGRRVTP